MAILAAALLIAPMCAAPADAATAPPRPRKPNVIFILADDLGYGDVGCYGQQRIETPSIDRMAAEGLRFTQAYAGGTVCAPSRCVLMTGLHVGHARVRGNENATKPGSALTADDVTVADVLHDAGYTTGLIGKWGLGEASRNTAGLPRQQGFDYFFGYLKHGEAHNYYPERLWRNESLVKLRNVTSKDPRYKGNVAEKKVDYSHDLFAGDALEFVRRNQDKPFFLYFALTIPHANNEAGSEGMEVPSYGRYSGLDWPEPQKGHAAMITRMDADVGRLLALLRELKIDDETLVIFTSDNGPAHREGDIDADFNDSNGPLRGYKGGVTEGGIRVPMIARWPGQVPAGETTDSPVYFADVLPTLAAIALAKAPAEIDGMDFMPTLLGNEQPELAERFLYWEWNKNGLRSQSARLRHWKAIRDPESGAIEIYDLAKDIGESHDLAARRPDLVAKFKEYFRTARSDDPHWPAAPTKKDSAKTAASE